MSDQDAFERVLTALHDAMLDDTLWPATSARIDEACGIQGHFLTVSADPPDDGQNLCSFIGLYYRGQRRADLEREYLERYYPLDERVPRYKRLTNNQLVHVTALYTAEELKTSPIYNEVLPQYSSQNSMNVRLVEPDGSYIVWGINDPVASDGWEAAQLSMTQALLPHLRQFIRVRQALAKAEALSASMTALLENPRIGVISLNQRGRIVLANDRARALLRQGDGLVERDGTLSVRESADRARLERLVAAALPTSGRLAVSGSMGLRRANGGPSFVVHVKPVGGRHPDDRRRVAALVLLVEAGQHAPIDPRVVAETLELAPVESRIAAEVVHGRTVREIAVMLGQTEGTVQRHLYSIYHRLGLSGQGALVRLVLSVARFA